MRTELRVENVENIVRLAATHISQIQAQMQVNNGELIVFPVMTAHSQQHHTPKSAQSLKKIRVRSPRGTRKTVSA
jgi:hypothetical protein